MQEFTTEPQNQVLTTETTPNIKIIRQNKYNKDLFSHLFCDHVTHQPTTLKLMINNW